MLHRSTKRGPADLSSPVRTPWSIGVAAGALAALQALFADNTTGDISPQDLRDFLVSVYPNGSGAGAVGLLAVTSYDPAIQETKSTASATLVDADAANMAATFTVPPSGDVLVRLTADGRTNSTSSGDVSIWGLRESTTDIDEALSSNGPGSGTRSRTSVALLVTGLTPGASVTYKWAHRTNDPVNAESDIFVGGVNGPAIMEVWAVP